MTAVDVWLLPEADVPLLVEAVAYTKALGAGFQHRFDGFTDDRAPGALVRLSDPARPPGCPGSCSPSTSGPVPR